MNPINSLVDELRNLPATVTEVDYRKRGYHLEILLQAEQVRQFAKILYDRDFYLVFVSAVHVLPAIEVIYQFADHSRPCRIIGRAPVTENGDIPTISDIFDGANWHERETKDMFGVVFSGHPYLQPLLLPEESPDLKPLLKSEQAVQTLDKLRRPANPDRKQDSTP